MNTNDIAEKLIAYCREAKWEAAQMDLYAEDAVSIEPKASEHFEKVTKGRPAIIAKGHKFNAMVEKIHSHKISDPLVTENTIAFKMTMDVDMRGAGRMNMTELCVYDVKDGKIVTEQFHL